MVQKNSWVIGGYKIQKTRLGFEVRNIRTRKLVSTERSKTRAMETIRILQHKQDMAAIDIRILGLSNGRTILQLADILNKSSFHMMNRIAKLAREGLVEVNDSYEVTITELGIAKFKSE